jgi:methylated-DNA-[protein]-cysteine S-methyltransferase
MGDRNKARAVGTANGLNPISIIIPCHRVIGSNRHLTGFGGGLQKKAFLLQKENIQLYKSRYVIIKIKFLVFEIT